MAHERERQCVVETTRRTAGGRSRAKVTPREEALLIGFRGGLIHPSGVSSLICPQGCVGQRDAARTNTFVADCMGCLVQVPNMVPRPKPQAMLSRPRTQ